MGFTERLSSWNTASAIHSWGNDWRDDVKAATYDVLKRVIDPVIGMLKVDCALQYPTGLILAMRNDGMVDSSRTYHNVVLVLLLQHERRTKNVKSQDELKLSCVSVMENLKKYFLHTNEVMIMVGNSRLCQC